MSVLNKMLKDIEQRDSSVAAMEPTAQVESVLDVVMVRNALFALIILLTLGGAGVYIWQQKPIQLHHETAQEATVQLLEKESLSTTAILKPKEVEPLVTEKEPKLSPKVSEGIKSNSPQQHAKVDEAPLVAVIMPEKTSNVSSQTVQPPPSEKAPLQAQSAEKAQALAAKPKPIIKASTVHKVVTQTSRADELFMQGKKAFNFGLMDDAVDALEQSINSEPTHKEARSLLAAAYYGRKETDKAVSLLDEGLARLPNVMHWRVLLARMQIEQKKYHAVLDTLAASFENNAPRDFWILKGTAAQQLKDHQLALHCFERLAQQEPSQAKWWLAVATAYDALAQYDAAQRYYTTATQVGGLSPNALRHARTRLQYIRGSK